MLTALAVAVFLWNAADDVCVLVLLIVLLLFQLGAMKEVSLSYRLAWLGQGFVCGIVEERLSNNVLVGAIVWIQHASRHISIMTMKARERSALLVHASSRCMINLDPHSAKPTWAKVVESWVLDITSNFDSYWEVSMELLLSTHGRGYWLKLKYPFLLNGQSTKDGVISMLDGVKMQSPSHFAGIGTNHGEWFHPTESIHDRYHVR